MEKGIFSDEEIANAINAALNNTSLDDEEIDKYFEGIFDVVSGKIQAKTAALRYRLDLKQLNMLTGLVKLKKADEMDGEEEEEESTTNVDGNDENTMEDKNLEKEDDEEEEIKDDGKHKRKAVKKEAIKKAGKNKPKGAKMESEKKSKSLHGVDIISPKPAKKKRRKNEEFLIEEAIENVFKGKDPDNQSLELALAKNHHDHEEGAAMPIGTRSRRTLINLPQKALIWKEKADNYRIESTSSSSHSGPSNSNDKSWAVVPFTFNIKPKASKGSIALAKPEKSLEAKKRNTANYQSAGNRNSVKFNERWTEYRQMVEDIVDDVLLGMLARNYVEKTKKIGMRAAILDILFMQIPVMQASKEQIVGVSTIRRYLKDVKIRLEYYLGDDAVDEEFLKQFQNYKETVTLKHFQEAMRRANKTIPREIEAKKESRKRAAENMMGTPNNTDENANESTNNTPLATKRLRISGSKTAPDAKMNGQKLLGKMNDVKSSPVKNLAEEGTSAGNTLEIENTPNPMGTVATLKEGQQQPSLHLMTSQQRERKPIKGTPAAIRKMVYDFFVERYQGDVNILANYLSELMVANARFKRYAEDCPQPIVVSAYTLFGRYFQVENLEVKEEDE